MVPGLDYIGVGVGAMVFNSTSRVFMARRGLAARNERGAWEFPGGTVTFGERLEDAIRREFREEYSMEVAPERLLGVFDHLIPAERQHWVSVTFIARHVSGIPKINEPEKCSEIGWFSVTELPGPLSLITEENVLEYSKGTG